MSLCARRLARFNFPLNWAVVQCNQTARFLSVESSKTIQHSAGRWVEAIDPATGFTFWYNEHTMEHRDKRPVEYNYQSFQDKPVDSKVKLVRGLDGRMWET